MKICVVFGHFNTENSFNACIRDTFIDEATKTGHEIDLINLYDENEQLPFYRSDINPPPKLVLDYRKRLEKADAMFLISACHNLRMNIILENWIDWVLHPTWFFSYKSIMPDSKFFGNYGYPVGNLKGKKAIIFCTYGSPQFAIRTFFLNMPTKRLKRGVFNLCGISDITYKRFFSVPFVSDEKRKKFLQVVTDTANKI